MWLILTIAQAASQTSPACSRWLEFDDIGYPNYRKLDLSGGIDTNNYEYVAPNGIATVYSSVDRYSSNGEDWYYLSNLFDGSLYFRSHGTTHYHSYWLGLCLTIETAQIIIAFDKPQNISHIVVEPRVIYTDRYSWYAIDGYPESTDYKEGHIEKAVHITQMINTDDDHFGKVHGHPVKGVYETIVFYLFKKGSYCTLNEIEIFVSDP